MDEPIYTLHSVVTEQFIQQIQPGSIKVVDNVDTMGALTGIAGNATIVPAGLVARRGSISDDRTRAHILPDELGIVPVRLGINEHAKTPNTEAIVDIVSKWAVTVPADIEAAFSTETHQS